MFDGSTAGRAFESAAAPYIFLGLALVSVLFWLWTRYEIRKYHENAESDSDEES